MHGEAIKIVRWRRRRESHVSHEGSLKTPSARSAAGRQSTNRTERANKPQEGGRGGIVIISSITPLEDVMLAGAALIH